MNLNKPKEDAMTHHKLIIGNCMTMQEIPDESVHLMLTSPPYFNAPFDYKGLFKDYDQYLEMLDKVAREVFRVLKNGRIAVLNIDDMLVNGVYLIPVILANTSIFTFFSYYYFKGVFLIEEV